MKRLLVFTGLFFLCFSLQAQDKEAILKVLTTQTTTWNKGDIDGFMKTYWKSDSLLFIGQKGLITDGKLPMSVIKKLILIKQQWASPPLGL